MKELICSTFECMAMRTIATYLEPSVHYCASSMINIKAIARSPMRKAITHSEISNPESWK
jgi:hypothetical protein